MSTRRGPVAERRAGRSRFPPASTRRAISSTSIAAAASMRPRSVAHSRKYAASTSSTAARTEPSASRRPGWLPSAEYLAAGAGGPPLSWSERRTRPRADPVPEDSMTRFQKLAIATTVTTLTLIVWGGVVRTTGSGDGCPDWPTCFGSWVPRWEYHTLIEYDAPVARGGLGAARRRPRRRRRRRAVRARRGRPSSTREGRSDGDRARATLRRAGRSAGRS